MPELNKLVEEELDNSKASALLVLLLQNIGIFIGVSTLYLITRYPVTISWWNATTSNNHNKPMNLRHEHNCNDSYFMKWGETHYNFLFYNKVLLHCVTNKLQWNALKSIKLFSRNKTKNKRPCLMLGQIIIHFKSLGLLRQTWGKIFKLNILYCIKCSQG